MVGLSSPQDIAKKLQSDYKPATVTTVIRGKSVKTPLSEAGVVPNNQVIIDGLSDYPWYWRVIPFSSLVKGALTDQAVTATTDQQRFARYAAERSAECRVEPKNAGVMVKDGAVKLDPAVDGQECSKDRLAQQLTAKPLQKGDQTVKVTTTAVKPARSDAAVAKVLSQAQAVADRQLTLMVAGKTYAIDKPTLASWLVFPDQNGAVTVGLDEAKVAAYLTSIQKDVYIAPGVTVITTADGIETSRQTGSSGRGIDTATTAKAVVTQALAGDGAVTASLTSLAPTLKYNRSYSSTPAGLQALVTDLGKSKPDMAISVRKLGDNGANYNGDKQYHPASTYKLFVAYSVLKRIDSNQLSWGQATTGGQTLGQCFDNMIVNSDNACAEWFGGTIGWNTLTGEAKAIGATRTTFGKDFKSTTNDHALLLQKLESNQLGLQESSRARLLDNMKRQVFRKGIPAGVGVPVANKVGFLDGYLHDSAIVYSPKGVYVMVIYSDKGSWSDVADVAKQINAQLQ
jgi:beta-lactamase class A